MFPSAFPPLSRIGEPVGPVIRKINTRSDILKALYMPNGFCTREILLFGEKLCKNFINDTKIWARAWKLLDRKSAKFVKNNGCRKKDNHIELTN
jgi:hypothetical protein